MPSVLLQKMINLKMNFKGVSILRTIFVSLVAVFLFLSSAKAMAWSNDEERVLQEQARLRTYPGGMEESDLKIQTKLFVPALEKPKEQAEETEF